MLKIHEFFSVATQLAYNAATIINQIRLSPDIGQKWKGKDDPVTIADIKAQTYIIQQLHKYWPTLKIVGEETTQYEEQIDLPDTTLNRFTEQFFNKTSNNKLINIEYEIENLCVWVDPLDGTLDFVQGDYENVTTLIGVSYKQEAFIGIISQPFTKINDKYEFKPKIYFGHYPQQRIFYIYNNEQIIPYELIKPKYNQIRFCTQKNRLTEEKFNKIQTLGCEIIKLGGSGKKSLCVLEGQAELFIYLGNKMSKWDICAPEALFKCFGGQFLGLEGQQYKYNHEDKSYDNQYGNLASIHPDLLNKFIQKTKGML